MGTRGAVVLVAIGGLAVAMYGYSNALLRTARQVTRESCVKGGSSDEVCDCVAERAWNHFRAIKFRHLEPEQKQLFAEFKYDRERAEMECAELHEPPGRGRLLGMLVRECDDQLHEKYPEKSVEYCTCVAVGVTANSEVVDGLSGSDIAEQALQRKKIGLGGLKVAPVTGACAHRLTE